MADTAVAWPRKTRELMNHHIDSTVWNDFKFRGDDIVIGTYAKSGTTWVQQIVAQLVFAGDARAPVHEFSPWVDLRVPPKEMKLGMLEGQDHRRILKTHLPLDALVFSPDARYLYIARDARDVVWSLHHHHLSANDFWYQLLNDTPGLVGPPIDRPDPDVARYFRTWLERDGFPFWPHWENIASWWAARHLPNVMLLHFSRLRADLAGEMKRIAAFLEIEPAPATWPVILEHCSFDYMKAHADQVAPLGGAIFDGGAPSFMNKGVNGRWRDVLTAADIAAYERTAEEKLGPDCARWLAGGEGG
jgi:aryl sulfotransferase